jgi:CBS-domain-containing membrane protein
MRESDEHAGFMQSRLFDAGFASRKRQAAVQATLAAITLAIVLVFEDALTNAAIVTAIASTAFLVFVNPGATMAQPRRVIGGHAVALVLAFLFSALLYHALPGSLDKEVAVKDGFAAGAVGVGILLMAVTNTEHAPAAGTVLGLVIEPWSLSAAAMVACAVLVLSGAKFLLRERLIDLL